MIVECSRRPDGWIPVIGNEEEISDFLWEQNYYTKCSIKETRKGFDFWVDTEFCGGEYFNNREGYFVKLNDDGSITVSEGQPSFEDYVAMEFNLTDDFDWVKWLLKDPNITSLIPNISTKKWAINPTPFEMQEESILVFDKNSKTLHNVLDRTSVTIDDVLLGNGYAVHGNSINQEIYSLEKRLQKSRNLEEKRCIIKRILSLKNGKNREG